MENVTEVVRGKKIYEGKANTLYETNDPDLLEMESTDRISAGNGEKQASMIKLEVIGRFISAGSFCKRYGINPGIHFKGMTYELCLKDDVLGDPFVSESAAAYALGVATNDQLREIKNYTYIIGIIAQKFFKQFDLTLVDFKVEFGLDKDGKIILCDEFSPDTCRLWDKEGKSFDKDVFRKGLGNVEETYKAILEKIQK